MKFNIKIKKKLFWVLMVRYIVFLGSAVVATALLLGGFVFVLQDILNTYPEVGEYLTVNINDIRFDKNTKDLSLSTPIAEGAWVEILEDNKVIYIEGEKKDEKMEYTQEDLAKIANNIDDLMGTSGYQYEYIPFTGLDGGKYILLYIMDRKASPVFRAGFDLPPSLEGTKFQHEINTKFGMLFTGFVIAIIIIILLFSRITSKNIIKPLKELNKGLQNVMNGDYSTRLDFKSNYEFGEIKDAFNYMASRLETAERENKEISESKKRLLLDISHDLRTPATTIQGYAEALNNNLVESEEKKKKYLNYIYEKSKLVTNLIDTLFKYSKLESKSVDLNRRVSDLSEFLRGVVIGFYGEIEEKNFKLNIEIPDTEVLYNFDKVEMERALSNIIGNIIKYNSEKTTLFVSLHEDNGNIEIVIGDNGTGIPEDIQKYIFNALVRGDNTRKTDGGTGLGLAISKKIIELHGGQISLESEEGKGSNFYINFKR